MRQTYLLHQLVEFIPEQLEDGVLYISQRYGTAAHRCCCGCGEEVITPLTPTDWSVWIDGRTVTLYPSIGNWSLACRSHYWIRRSTVKWAGQMTQKEIEHGRSINRATKAAYFDAVNRKNGLSSQTVQYEKYIRIGTTGVTYKLWLAVKRWWAS